MTPGDLAGDVAVPVAGPPVIRRERRADRVVTVLDRRLEPAEGVFTPDPKRYGLVMPAAKRPTPQDAAAARQIVLDGLARDADLDELAAELAPLHPRYNTFPGEVFLGLAADALDWCGASRQQPLDLEGIRERFLPECSFRGRQNRKVQFAVLAAAAQNGGTVPDLLDEVRWWQSDDFWEYAMYAAIAYIRAAAERLGTPVPEACRQLAQRASP